IVAIGGFSLGVELLAAVATAGRLLLVGHFLQPAGLYVEDKAAHLGTLADPGMSFGLFYLFADVLIEIIESVEACRSDRRDTGLFSQFGNIFVFLEGQHSTVHVMDEDEFFGAKQILGDNQGTNRALIRDASGVANDMRFPDL